MALEYFVSLCAVGAENTITVKFMLFQMCTSTYNCDKSEPNEIDMNALWRCIWNVLSLSLVSIHHLPTNVKSTIYQIEIRWF